MTLGLPQPPRAFYRHGWQSWSLTAWTDPVRELPVMKPEIFHSRQTDPVYAKHPHPNGSWLGAVEMEDGKIIFLGALGLEAHVSLRENQLQGWYESGSGEWFVARGNELEVFEQYASLLGERFGKATSKPAPRVWCSWYSFYKEINEKKIQNVLRDLGDLPFDVVQIDDGWQVAPGDWIPNAKFPSGMDSLAASIRATGRKAGLWMAPLAIGEKSGIFKEHPDWLLQGWNGKPVSAGFEWGGDTFALDVTNPQAADWLANTIRTAVNWGYDYLKLDFLYAGALPGKRHVDMPREAAYRHALEIMRRAAGDAYLLVCGSPIIPSLGLCDAMRVGPDVANLWDSRLYSYLLYNQTTPGMKNGIRTTLNRLWLKSLVHVDPDVAFFHESKSLTAEQRQLFQDLTEICGFKATSDLPSLWAETERERVRAWLTNRQESARVDRTRFTVGGRSVDFSPAMDLPPRPGGFALIERAIVSWFGEQLWALQLWDWLLRTNPTKTKEDGGE
ncbi:MAG: alpha-galactosidase [Anaerolineaceae bacterium]|nr:MAG: alpha-galactosidase [Anaerolineaceae bacterium]